VKEYLHVGIGHENGGAFAPPFTYDSNH
jgi:hypothetical protein